MSFSVIIPTYNRKKYLQKALESVLNQTQKFDELIIVDNCSTDGTADFVKSIQDPRIKYLCHEANIGPQKNWESAFKAACCDYIALLEDDNIWYANHLSEANAYFEKNPLAGIYACGADFISEDEIKLNKFHCFPFAERKNSYDPISDGGANYLLRTPFLASSLVFRKSAIQAIEFSKGYNSVVMDFLWWGHIIAKGHQVVINDSINIAYRVHDNSITGQLGKMTLFSESLRSAQRQLYSCFQEAGIIDDDKLKRNILQYKDFYGTLLLVSLCSHPNKAVRENYLKFLKSNKSIFKKVSGRYAKSLNYFGLFFIKRPKTLDMFINTFKLINNSLK